MPKRPNVLIFCVDEMRADHLACAGNRHVNTPNLDRLAARGTLFRRGTCNNPICMPARATMFTGLLPRDHGLRVNGQTAHPGIPWLAQILADAGYRTHAAGKLHLTPWVPRAEASEALRYPEAKDFWDAGIITSFPAPYKGFQSVDFVGGHTRYIWGDYVRWLQERGGSLADINPADDRYGPEGRSYRMSIPEALHYNRFIADSTIDLIRASASSAAPPFFAWCSFPDPHMPVAAPSPYYEMYDPNTVSLPVRRERESDALPAVYKRVLSGELRPNGVDNSGMTDAAWREIIACTYSMVTHLDAEIGRVLDALDDSGQADSTLILFVSDHGDMMGDHGLLWKSFYTFRGCLQIPYIAAVPDGTRGCVSDALVCQLDVLPSILDWCELPLPGAAWPEHETPFQRGMVRPLTLYPGRSWLPLLRGKAQSIHDEVVVENDDPTMGFQVRTLVTPKHRLTIYPGLPDGELFDLENDPDELVNLWDAPGCTALRADLTARLLDAYSLQTPWYPVPPWNS